ncbi:MAG: serine/threonine protein kinase, partial [Myxococcaceae bacterium]|nr:serine/threonine protein kinase [Myxococcaceae bacterium]
AAPVASVPPAKALAPATHASSSASNATATATAPRAAAAVGGFGDPTDGDRRGATTWKVQDHPVRLLTRLVSNESNVTDAVVRKAVDWSAWEYLRCYEAAFKSSKDLPEGTVTVGFEIIDQLPRHGTLVSTTFASKTMADCVVNTLIGKTINAAGPDGRGKVVYAFKFMP